MNNTQGIDAKAFLSGWLGNLVGMYSADINAVPDDKWATTFGGCTRPCSDLTADALSLMVWTTNVMNDSPQSETMMEDLGAACATKAGATEKMKEVSDSFLSSFARSSDEKLLTPVQTPFGMEMPLYAVAQIAVSHIWYHDGQLNYVHCLLGDDKVHWMP
ncbi:MAG: hypothetical protein KF812_01050 [Fimbriimonadaceae bacterium]|nr:hypothetical protein [Fimbriimonadaceae bacterium]